MKDQTGLTSRKSTRLTASEVGIIGKEIRQGKTGKWQLMLETKDGKVIATSEWGTNYEFNKKEWEELPIIMTDNNN